MDSFARLLHLSPPLAWMALKLLIVIGGVMGIAAVLTWVERRGAAMMQDRIGPNRAGVKGITLLGLVQLAADGIKFFLKEDVVPPHGNRLLFTLAPALAFVPAMLGFAVIPFGQSFSSGGQAYHLSLLDPGNGMGMLYPLAIGSMAVYGILVASWSSNNKWAILGGMRSGANMVSYELGMSLAVISIFMAAGNSPVGSPVTLEAYDPHRIVEAQEGLWFAVRQPLGFLVFFTCMFAETNRLPFDFAEGESEIVAGFHTEYSSMKFALLQLSEYIHIVTASALLVTLYLGGWRIPFVPNPGVLLSVAAFLAKLLFLCWVFVWVRWTIPRFRYDQLMFLGWKVMLPLSMANLLLQAWLMHGRGIA
ncbi:MAG: NADH-quinone oxidoreductase subunit NuoH [Acidobacteria bacterium]|nr:NADH-quinone oxidoreductase subunit NuoH [Acidobacteriota bacterium]